MNDKEYKRIMTLLAVAMVVLLGGAMIGAIRGKHSDHADYRPRSSRSVNY